MATEEGIVIKTGSRRAWVKTTRTSACKACASRNSCHLSEDGQEMEVEVLNDVGAKVGDRIRLGVDSGALMKISFLLYIFPILMMLVGAVIGQKVAPDLAMDGSGLAALCGFAGFLLAFVVVRLRGRGLSRNPAYHPRIIKILRPIKPRST
jgi:sigma-E factor negative regulatory protein RseC